MNAYAKTKYNYIGDKKKVTKYEKKIKENLTVAKKEKKAGTVFEYIPKNEDPQNMIGNVWELCIDISDSGTNYTYMGGCAITKIKELYQMPTCNINGAKKGFFKRKKKNFYGIRLIRKITPAEFGYKQKTK
jgi:formylglycine-generating enzyme required for sulfatase activity